MIPRAHSTPRLNFQDTNWDAFNEHLCLYFANLPSPTTITNQRQFNQAVNDLTKALQDAISYKVPIPEESSYKKQ